MADGSSAGPAALGELPDIAAALVAGQLDVERSAIDPARLNVELSRFRASGPQDLEELGWMGERAPEHDGPLALLRSAVDWLRRKQLGQTTKRFAHIYPLMQRIPG